MSINFHRQRAAILVAEPATDCRYINARFNATRGEQVAQIMMRDADDAQLLAGRINSTLTFVNEHDWLARNSVSPRSFCRASAKVIFPRATAVCAAARCRSSLW